MHLNKIVKITFCILLSFSMAFSYMPLHAQVQSHQTTVIDFLGRMAQKGKIEFNDLIKPIDRKIIFQKLEELKIKKIYLQLSKKNYNFLLQVLF